MEDEDRMMYGEPPGIPENVMDEGAALPDWDLAYALDQAAQHARRATILRLRGQEIGAMFAAEIDRLTERMVEILEPMKNEVERRERMVELIHRRYVKKIGKTLKLPTGPDSKLTKGQPEFVVDDEEKLRAWAAANDLEGRLWPRKPAPEPTLNRNELKAVAKLVGTIPEGEPGTELPVLIGDGESGEAIPGLVVRAPGDRWNYGKKAD